MSIDPPFDPATFAIYFAIGFAVAVIFAVSSASTTDTNADLGLVAFVSLVGGAVWPVSLPGLMLWGIAKLVHKLAGRKKDRQTRKHEELRTAYHELLAKHRALEEQLAQKRAEGKYR